MANVDRLARQVTNIRKLDTNNMKTKSIYKVVKLGVLAHQSSGRIVAAVQRHLLRCHQTKRFLRARSETYSLIYRFRKQGLDTRKVALE